MRGSMPLYVHVCELEPVHHCVVRVCVRACVRVLVHVSYVHILGSCLAAPRSSLGPLPGLQLTCL